MRNVGLRILSEATVYTTRCLTTHNIHKHHKTKDIPVILSYCTHTVCQHTPYLDLNLHPVSPS